MKIGNRTIIGSGAIAGFFVGRTVSNMFFGDLLLNQPTPRHIVVIVFFIIVGAFIGHVMRYAPEHDKNEDNRNEKDN